jgi:hypothetical protein
MNSDPHRPVVLSDFLTEMEARLLIGFLEAQGIKAFNSGTGGATGWPDAAAYVQVVVREVDLEVAKAAMQQWLEDAQDEPDEDPEKMEFEDQE